MSDYVRFVQGGVVLRGHIEETLQENLSRRYHTHYSGKRPSYLSALCEACGSDKGAVSLKDRPYAWLPHTYADWYERQFGSFREHVRNVFECGLGTNNPDVPSNMGERGKPGASLRVWRDYFHSAEIYGADVDRRVLFSEDRIKTFYVDQTDPAAIDAMWAQVGDVQFDLFIDDGLHTPDGAITLLKGSLHRVREGGLYVIEDVNIEMMIALLGHLSRSDLNYEVVTLYRPGLALGDNSLVVIRK
jgi:hypothetical protein